MKRGIFISLEGSDGSGKSTLVKGLRARVDQAGLPFDFTREPGGTPISEAIRTMLLDRANEEMDPRCEALLYAAARAQHVAERIRPKLLSGIHVFTERFVLSSLAYQGVGRGLGIEPVRAINQFATQDLEPDLILYMEADPLRLMERKGGPEASDRLETAGDAFYRAIAQGYETSIQGQQNVVRVDALQKPEEVLAACWQAIIERIGEMA